jgi:predicted nuclease of restriction endonuclease-like (RecB) superfamily
MSDLANQTLKDPYIFDFLTLSEDYKEKDIEKQLVQNITKSIN